MLNKIAEEMIKEQISSIKSYDDKSLLEIHQPSFKKSLLDWLDRNENSESNDS
jgi:hypothetical protein